MDLSLQNVIYNEANKSDNFGWLCIKLHILSFYLLYVVFLLINIFIFLMYLKV